jgi:hypothetical protein
MGHAHMFLFGVCACVFMRLFYVCEKFMRQVGTWMWVLANDIDLCMRTDIC